MRKTLPEMKPLVKAYKESGLSVRKYCQLHNLKDTTFVYWIRKIRKKKKSSTAFIPIQLKPKVVDRYIMEVEQRDGTQYRFKELVTAEYLNSILSRP